MDSSPGLQQRLRVFLQSQPHPWAYSIFWQLLHDDDGHLFLSWGDGHFRPPMEPPHPERRRSVVRALDNNDLEMEVSECAQRNVTGTEWFYVMSLTKSFQAGHGFLGKALRNGPPIWLTDIHKLEIYDCQRAREAGLHRIHTLACIPVIGGVLELASAEVIPESWGLVQQAKSLFCMPAAPPFPPPLVTGAGGSLHLVDCNIPFADIGET